MLDLHLSERQGIEIDFCPACGGSGLIVVNSRKSLNDQLMNTGQGTILAGVQIWKLITGVMTMTVISTPEPEKERIGEGHWLFLVNCSINHAYKKKKSPARKDRRVIKQDPDEINPNFLRIFHA